MKNKQIQLQRIEKLLRPGGRVIVEDTFFLTDEISSQHRNRSETQFVQDEVFGFAEILSLPDFLEKTSRSGLQIQSLLEHSRSYSRTIGLWLEKLYQMKNHPKTWQTIKYLKIAQKGWRRTIANYLIELHKVES